MSRIFFFLMFLIGVASCTFFEKKKREVLLTCDFFLQKKGKGYEIYFQNYIENKKTIISEEVEKLYWKDCEIIVEERKSYLYITLEKDSLKIKKFIDFNSLNQFFSATHDSIYKFRLRHSEGVYNSLAY